MKRQIMLLLVFMLSLNFALTVRAESETEGKVVEDVYPSLASGALSSATLADLPEGRILESDSLVISESDMDSYLEEIPSEVRDEIKNNLFFLLEEKATMALLLQLAKEEGTGQEEQAAEDNEVLLQKYFEQIVGDIEVSDDEVAKFYEENKDLCGGATLEQVKDQLNEYVLQQKQQKVVTEHIRSLGERLPVKVSADWTKKQAVLAMDNTVDEARASGKPSFVDFGADNCRPCEMMEPILEDMKSKYDGKMNIEFIHVRQQQVLAARYGVQAIPVQILFDKNGKEVWRHTGFIPQKEIEEQLKKVDVE